MIGALIDGQNFPLSVAEGRKARRLATNSPKAPGPAFLSQDFRKSVANLNS